jgi:hypothetical protein
MQFQPCQTQSSTPKFNTIFILVFGLWFVHLDHWLTIKLLIFFKLTLDLVNFSLYNHAPFLVWSLVLDFFNQVPNFASNYNILITKPLICLIKAPKKPIKSPDFNLFQLTSKLTPKTNFPYNQVLNKIN